MERRLIEYLPPMLRRVREYDITLDRCEQPEMESAWTASDGASDNQYIATLDVYGVRRWERMLGLARQAGDTLDDRRFRIYAHMNATLPYTITALRNSLDSMLGVDGYTLWLENELYTLHVRVELSAKAQFDAVDELLRRVAPANIVVDLLLRYKTHEEMRAYTHAFLSQYTHDEIRNEVI